MRPTLNPSDSSNDWILLWKFRKDAVQRNDVILFKSPMDPKKILCKRVKGVELDKVFTKYPYPKDSVIVPRNHIWVEGDNVTHSIDSNEFGPISKGLIVGSVATIIWPPSRWGTDLKETLGRNNILKKNIDT